MWQWVIAFPSEENNLSRRITARSEDLASLGNKMQAMEYIRSPRRHQPSRFARETFLSPRASRCLKLNDREVKVGDLIRPPYADQPLEFVNNADNGYLVQAKYSENRNYFDQTRKSLSREDELIKYKGEKKQDSVLNYGVLGWGRRRLEKWTHKQSKSRVSKVKIDFPPDMGSLHSLQNKKQEINVKDNVRITEDVVPKHAKGNSKEKDRKKERNKKDMPYIRDGIHPKPSKSTPNNAAKLSNQDDEAFERPNDKKPINYGVLSQKCSEQFITFDFDSSSQHCSGEQESIVVLLPKDFSTPCSSEGSRKESVNEKLAHYNSGSFSDLSSFGEVHTDESDNDLVMKLDSLMKSKGVELPELPYDMSPRSSGSYRATSQSSVETDKERSWHQRVGFGLARMTKNLSSKEGSRNPSRNSTSSSEIFKNSNPNIHAKARSGPLKRFLDPLLKFKTAKQAKEHSNDLTAKPTFPVVGQPVKALFHLTMKNGLPLFKFVVETNNEILASTAKTSSSFGKHNDISLLYTFYSVHKVGEKSRNWKYQKVRSFGFEYNVVGQMKVSEPHLPSCHDQNTTERRNVKEFVLYSADVSCKSDTGNSEIMTGTELAAVVVNMLPSGDHTMVILPGGDHSLPREGVASSLITRWKAGGLCDCGGWDEGCNLRVLDDIEKEDCKGRRLSRSQLVDFRCGLYDQGGSNQSKPFFTLVPFRDGIFSVEFDAKMSSLQAFSICVAVINAKQPSLCYSSGRCVTDDQTGSIKSGVSV